MTAADDFNEILQAVRTDGNDCAAIVYTMLTIQARGANAPALIERLDRHAGFWNVTLGAMQNSGVAAMGRIYDKRNDVHSAAKLLKFAKGNLGIFSAADLQARKQARGLDAQTAAAYVAASFIPSAPQDFDVLEAALSAAVTLYKSTVEPIRHKAVAHRGNISRANLVQLYGNVQLADFERLAVFPTQLCEALWQLFENGERPDLPAMPTSVGDMLANPLGARSIGYQQQYSVREAAAFLDWLVLAP
jgi:hypothetical protein